MANVVINNSHIKLAVVVETTLNAECIRTNIGNQMIDIFFDNFGYDKEHHFVASIAYEYDDLMTKFIIIKPS